MIELITSFIDSGFNLIVVTILTPVISFFKGVSGSLFTIILLAMSLIISYFLAKWEKFVNIISGSLGLTIIFTIIIFIIFKLIGGLV